MRWLDIVPPTFSILRRLLRIWTVWWIEPSNTFWDKRLDRVDRKTSKHTIIRHGLGVQRSQRRGSLWRIYANVQNQGTRAIKYQNTITLDARNDEYPLFIVSDLSRDQKFSRLPVVGDTVASYRFYAGYVLFSYNKSHFGIGRKPGLDVELFIMLISL